MAISVWPSPSKSAATHLPSDIHPPCSDAQRWNVGIAVRFDGWTSNGILVRIVETHRKVSHAVTVEISGKPPHITGPTTLLRCPTLERVERTPIAQVHINRCISVVVEGDGQVHESVAIEVSRHPLTADPTCLLRCPTFHLGFHQAASGLRSAYATRAGAGPLGVGITNRI